MKRALILLAVCLSTSAAQAQLQRIDLDKFNRKLAGVVLDFTHNHHEDNRIYSEILCAKRDLYVYLPPCYDPNQEYPLILWLHGAFGDEHAFLDTAQLDHLDQLIRCGCFPPTIVVCPDGTCRGENWILAKHSFYVNGVCCGRFEDHVMQEVLPWVLARYKILPCKNAHVVIGDSGGGFGAMNLALKYRDYFAYVATLSGVINVLYSDVCGDYFAEFCPQTYRWRQVYDPNMVIGKFGHGLIRIKAKTYVTPVFGNDAATLDRMRSENPANLLAATGLQPGELEIFMSFGGKDNLNTDDHAKSFAWLACQQGVSCRLVCYPDMDHSLDAVRTGQRDAYAWLSSRLWKCCAAEGEINSGASD